MDAKAALIAVHGMGRTSPDYSDGLHAAVRRRLGSRASALHQDAVYYQGVLQVNEQYVWGRVASSLRWHAVREFLLFGFADAAGLEANKDRRNSAYLKAQIEIARTLLRVQRAIGERRPVLVLAQSLGGQVLSNYLWDAQRFRRGETVHAGFWRAPQANAAALGKQGRLSDPELGFLAGETIAALWTTGCNIPIFLAAHDRMEIKPIARPNPAFVWHNYYDRDDVLGWPLQPLSDDYAALVQDHAINAAGGTLGRLLKSWNPLSHAQYWRDRRVLDPLCEQLAAMLQP